MKLPGMIRPLFWLALAGHVGLLAIPISGASDEIVPAPDPVGDSITVTRIPPTDNTAAAQARGLSSAGQRTPQARSTTAAARQATSARRAATSSRPAAGDRATTGNRTAAGDRSATGSRAAAPQTQNRASNGRRTPNRSATSAGEGNRVTTATAGGQSSNAPDPSLPNLPNRPPATPPTSPSAAVGTDASTGETSLIATLASGASGGNVERLSGLVAFFHQAFTYSPIQTSDDDERHATEDWLATLQAETGRDNLTPQTLEIPLQLAYPLEETVGFDVDDPAYNRDFLGCLTEAPHPATVGVYFDRNGELVDDPQLLRSSGYDVLNVEAVERVKTLVEFPEDRAQQAFVVPVAIDYDAENCLQRVVIQADLPD